MFLSTMALYCLRFWSALDVHWPAHDLRAANMLPTHKTVLVDVRSTSHDASPQLSGSVNLRLAVVVYNAACNAQLKQYSYSYGP